MLLMEEKELEKLLENERKKGILTGIRLMEERMLLVCESGSAIAIKDRAYFVKSDIQNLRDIMENIGK